jgi:hypothetical protein
VVEIAKAKDPGMSGGAMELEVPGWVEWPAEEDGAKGSGCPENSGGATEATGWLRGPTEAEAAAVLRAPRGFGDPVAIIFKPVIAVDSSGRSKCIPGMRWCP